MTKEREIIANAGEWRIKDGNDIANVLTEKFNPDLYDLDEEYKNEIQNSFTDQDFYIEVKEDKYWIGI